MLESFPIIGRLGVPETGTFYGVGIQEIGMSGPSLLPSRACELRQEDVHVNLTSGV
jgi:hypothetical protein